MNKDKILEMSRIENNNQDLYAKEISQKAGNIAAVVAAILATMFYVIQILIGLGENYGLYAIVFSIPAIGYLVTAIQTRSRRDAIVGIIFIIAAVIFSVLHINHLVTTSTIL